MIIVVHRKNTAKELSETPTQYGVEMDLRNHGNRLTVNHDAFVEGEDFDAWLKAYKHRLLILNTKEEGLEKYLIEKMVAHKIEDYFFLDTTPPYLLRLLRGQMRDDGKPERRVAHRISEYEDYMNVLTHRHAGLMAEWIWVDFTEAVSAEPRATMPQIKTTLTLLQEAKQLQVLGYKLCLVSPELYGPHRLPETALLQQLLAQVQLKPEAVCTKQPHLWEPPALQTA